jgi:hypothetical protein
MTPRDGTSSGRAFAAALLAFAGASAAFWALDGALPLEVPVIGPKWEYFERERDSYTFLAIGTSLTYRHFVPEIFDRVLAEAGIPSKSFNFGVPGLALPEAYRIVDRLAGRPPERLRWVAIDLSLFSHASSRNRMSTRDIWWHTPTETRIVVERLLESDRTAGEKRDEIRHELSALVRNLTTVGRGARWFREFWDDRWVEDDDAGLVVEAQGYEALEDLADPKARRRGERFRENTAQFRSVIERRRQREWPRDLPDAKLAMLERIAHRLADAGITPVFFEPPTWRDPYRAGPLEDEGPVFSYSDPVLHADLYRVEHRFDRYHLTRAGAVLLTERFARDFARYVRDSAAVQ